MSNHLRFPPSAVRSIPRLARWLFLLLLLSLFLPFFLSPPSPPSSFLLSQSPHSSHSCSPFSALHHSGFCIGSCNSECFPRMRRICFSSLEVKVCQQSDFKKPLKGLMIESTKRSNESVEQRLRLPTVMRFHGEQLTLPVRYAICNNVNHWVRGLSLIADQRFLPAHKPNPHHEAEKLIPALLLVQNHALRNATFYWFSSREEMSEWARGFLEAFDLELKLQYLDLPTERGTEMCFEDAIIFSAPTNLWYIPDQATNSLLRDRVLQHCSIPSVNVSRPLRSAAVIDRVGGLRHLANKEQVAETVSRVLKVPVKQTFSGTGSFCDQVKAVVNDDILIVPHGSQNVNLIFARPGTIVIEVFPFLFYTDALRNYTHASQLRLYSNLGVVPPKNIIMWFFSLFGWDACYNKLRFCKNFSRRQPIYADIAKLEEQLLEIRGIAQSEELKAGL